MFGTSIREDHWEKMNGMNSVWSPEDFPVDELDRHYLEIISKFTGSAGSQVILPHEPASPGTFGALTRCGIGFAAAKAKSVLKGRRGLLTSGTEVHLDTPTPASVANA